MRLINSVAATTLVASVFMALAGKAAAHIVLADPEAKAGSYYAGFFRLGHGCDGSPTTGLRVEIPAGIVMARPQPKPGWTVAVEHEPLAAPLQSEYGEITERVKSITWTGSLPADQFDEFGLLVKLPETTGPIYFKTEQTCEAGSRSWTDIPSEGQAWHDVPSPAPVLMLVAPPPADDGRGHHP